MITRTEGVTASFLKELLRRAAMYAAEDAAGQDPGTTADHSDAQGGPLTVRDVHMNAALDELLDSRNQLTRILLGGHPAHRPARIPQPGRALTPKQETCPGRRQPNKRTTPFSYVPDLRQMRSTYEKHKRPDD